MESAPEAAQALLYSLRSPTIPLPSKLTLAQSAVVNAPSPLLFQLIRDWILLDLFLRSRNAKDEGNLLNLEWWTLLGEVVGNGASSTTVLPIFVSFASSYAASSVNRELVEAVAAVWKKLASGAMRKATVDAALEGYSVLLKSSVTVAGRSDEDMSSWEDFSETWLKAFRAVVDAGKGGKKIPLHTLSNLPSIIPLLSILPPTSPLYLSLLSTVQFSLFNIDNLRRGIARESYNAGGAESKDDTTEAAEGELFSALSTCLQAGSISEDQVYHALPLFFNLYRTSLASHATSLFPLPIRSNFPTASAARSALEIHSLQKMRALSAGWIKGSAALLQWSTIPIVIDSSSKPESLRLSLVEVEEGDLYRGAKGEGWDDVLEDLAQGSIARLSASSSETHREALIGLLGAVLRLAFTAIESALPAVLAILSSTAASTTPSHATSTFLLSLLVHHSRSLLLPSLLVLLSEALASSSAVPNNLLKTHGWNLQLSKALGGMVAMNVKTCWEDLVGRIQLELVKKEESGERSSKRRKKEESSDPSPQLSEKAASARIQLLELFTRSLPSPIPIASFEQTLETLVQPILERKASGELRGSALGVRYAMRERIRLDGVECGDQWNISEDFAGDLVALVAGDDNEIVLEATRSLLQSLLPNTARVAAQEVLASVLARFEATVEAQPWSGHVEGLSSGELPTALWELITRRWLGTFEHFGTSEQLQQLAQIIVGSIGSESTSHTQISIGTVTARLLRRADFYELRQLQAHVQTALFTRVSIPSLSPPSDVLAALSSKKLPKPLRSLVLAPLLEVVEIFQSLTSPVPMEYVSKSLRNDLIDRAMGLDIWLSARKVEVDDEALVKAQSDLRKFVLLAAPVGSSITDGALIFGNLLVSTDNESTVTIELYKHFLKSAITSYTSEKSPTALIAYISAFGTPLAELTKRLKKGANEQTCSDLAFFALCDLLTSLPEFKSLLTELQTVISATTSAALASFSKALSYSVKALNNGDAASADMIRACRSMWALRDWLAASSDDEALYISFSQTVLSSVASITHTASITSPAAHLATLDLLSYRVARLRAISDPVKISTLPFETLLACHVSFRSLLKSSVVAFAAANEGLRRATSSATIKEYGAALEGISGLVASATGSTDSLESALDVASTLLRDGPEGSSRLSSNCLSEILRHISLYLVDQSTLSGASGATTFLVVSRFVEGICGDRPMLLSRQHVSSALSLVSRMLEPPSGTTTTADNHEPTSAALASELFLSLVNTVSNLVRHRKDHISPLFPHLVSTITSFLSALRRAGFGTTGSASNIEDVEAGISLGRRAEREARITFPFWVWEGGALGISRQESKAVGRLLASLTSKTTATMSKRKFGAEEKEKDNAPSTTSLAAPLSKHAPFIILPYLRSCVHVSAPIPSVLRMELQGGWFELMDVMGKWEREALMKGFLRDDEEAERGVLRGMWRTWEKERYRG